MDFNWTMFEETVDGVTYSLVFIRKKKYRLRITGSGKIPGRDRRQPWLDFRRQISDVWIDEGITEIGRLAFSGDPLLERVWLPASLRSIGPSAFANCPMLEEVVFSVTPEQLKQVDIPAGALPEWFDLS